ncbi:MAG: holo-[acyl-carrier-protein] synthase [Candidatus Zixiibacteriota bacterium]|nr:MAG: holo-[acyl-carrier-protein] synthase [candidate division Zixibacteria bacterium]HDL02659.1 holo-[acyl-carrier-protein] synthase [candidate division Zixibacteria bacterium]
MIYSVGIDLIELERVSNALDKWGDKFARRILGEEERILYREKKNKVQFLAGRFAAKEAVMKSLGTFFDSGVHLRDIQVLNDLYGKPYVHLDDRIREKIIDKEVKVSITHERKMAAAVAIVTGD